MRRVTIYVAAAATASWAVISHFAWGGKPGDAAGISLRIERTIAVPRETVFQFWTDPHAVAKWFLPPDHAHWTEPPKLDARRRGRFSLRLVSKEEFYDLHRIFREMRPPKKLVLNCRWGKEISLAGSPGNTVVTERGASSAN